MGEAARKRKSKDDKQAEMNLLFPYLEVKLQCGQVVTVRQWNLEMGLRLSERIVSLITRIQKAGLENSDPSKWIAVALPQISEIVRETIGWEPEDFNTRLTFEDLLDLFAAVVKTSLVREDGGALPKLVQLVAELSPTSAGAPDAAA